MFFPYNTDAPIYYFPIITICMIVVNVLVFGYDVSHPGELENCCLAIGNGIHPTQWLTSCFMHASLEHLLGNMIALWVFGLIVEGKLGPWKTLLVYLGIGMAESGSEQIILLGFSPTHSLGASSIVYGFMAMCLIWAPKNDINCIFFIYWRAFYIDVPIMIFVGLYIGNEIFMLILSRQLISSAFFHCLGAFWGFAVAITMLKKNWVDCENWDVFSVWNGRHLMTDAERAKQDASTPEAKRARAERKEKRLGLLRDGINNALREGNPVPAYVIYGKLKKEFPDCVLNETDMLTMIQLLLEKRAWTEAIELMKEYLVHFTGKETLVRLNLANVLLEQNQPGSALEVLSKIDADRLDATQSQYFRRLREKAAKMLRS